MSTTAEDLPDRGPGPLGRARQERLGLFRNHHGQRQNQNAAVYSLMTRLGPVPNLVRTHTRVWRTRVQQCHVGCSRDPSRGRYVASFGPQPAPLSDNWALLAPSHTAAATTIFTVSRDLVVRQKEVIDSPGMVLMEPNRGGHQLFCR